MSSPRETIARWLHELTVFAFWGIPWEEERAHVKEVCFKKADELLGLLAPGTTPPEAAKVTDCEDCGLAYGCERWVEAVIPDEMWEKINPGSEGGGILCIGCISRRLRRLGIDKVPVILSGMEALRAATEDEIFDRGWKAAVGRITELENELAALRPAASPAPPEEPTR